MRMDPRQFDFTQRKWRWRNLDDDTAKLLAEHAAPEDLLCIKSTDSRAVYRFDDLYIKVCGSFKLKDILFPAAKAEYKTYQALANCNIPVVKHLGWGRVGHYTALVTEAWTDDAVDALNYWYKLLYNVEDTGDFLKSLGEFLKKVIESPLQHGDFHFGNILYSPREKSFALVDLHNVSAGKTHTQTEKLKMLQILAELRGGIRPQYMLEMFSKLSGADEQTAADEIRKRLIRDKERLHHDWLRRRKQFLQGYSKFSDFVVWKNAVLLVQRDKLRKNLFKPSEADKNHYCSIRLSFKAALELMLFSFYLSMLQVPHNPVIALHPNGTVFLEQLPENCIEPDDREWINSYNEYLLCMGLHLEDYSQWRILNNQQLLLADFSSMLAAMPNREMFRPEKVDPRQWKIRKR